jgi:hypothetical protein
VTAAPPGRTSRVARGPFARPLRTGLPGGRAPARVAVQAEALIAKRRRVAQRAWPELAAALGDTFAPAFEEYARATPRRTRPASDRARPDAVEFALHLSRRGLLPTGFRGTLLRARLRGR